MSLTVIFLGTAGSVPTSQRALPTLLVRRKGEYLMFDCGEGTQRQMIKAKLSFHRKMKIFITHMHGDHMLGLPGLLQTMSMMNREHSLKIYGPEGISNFINSVKKSVQFGLTFPVEIFEVRKDGILCEEREYIVKSVWARHVIPSLSYALIEKPRPGKFNPKKARKLGVPEGPMWSKLQHGEAVKLADGRIIMPNEVVGQLRRGRKIVYSGDTRPFDGLVKLAKNADLLIHDATLDDSLAERANEEGHSTPSQAAETALKAKAKRLVLNHISARYRDPEILLEQAREIFPDTVVAEDFMHIEVPLPQE
jgi:ribonuclease Z